MGHNMTKERSLRRTLASYKTITYHGTNGIVEHVASSNESVDINDSTTELTLSDSPSFTTENTTNSEPDNTDQSTLNFQAVNAEIDNRCNICYVNYGEPDGDGTMEEPFTPPCKHTFGARCIIRHSIETGQPNCPVCRRHMLTGNPMRNGWLDDTSTIAQIP